MARRSGLLWAFLLAHSVSAFGPRRPGVLRRARFNHSPVVRPHREVFLRADTTDVVAAPSLATMKVAELKLLAAVRGLKVGAMKKADLVALLTQPACRVSSEAASAPPRAMPLRMAAPEVIHDTAANVASAGVRAVGNPDSSGIMAEDQTWKEKSAAFGLKNPDSASGRLGRLPRLDAEGLVVNRTALLPDLKGESMELQFVGTASCMASSTRGVSCLALRRDGDVMVFDAGEGSQTLLQQSTVTATKISRVFVTHAHGDHTFGLIGLLCMVGQECDRSGAPIDVYGPDGLRAFLRASAQLSVSRIVAPYRVHELKEVPWLMPLPPYMAPPEVGASARASSFVVERNAQPSAQLEHSPAS